jgi:hypothetical protein
MTHRNKLLKGIFLPASQDHIKLKGVRGFHASSSLLSHPEHSFRASDVVKTDRIRLEVAK